MTKHWTQSIDQQVITNMSLVSFFSKKEKKKVGMIWLESGSWLNIIQGIKILSPLLVSLGKKWRMGADRCQIEEHRY